MPAPESLPGGDGYFATTHWSVVIAARDAASTQAFAALSQLCETYWYPLYAYVRRRGNDADQARDLTQEFFARLLQDDFLLAVDRGKGRFRSFLLASMNHFLAKEWTRANRQKRGGGCAWVSLQAESAEDRYRREPASLASPDQLFERRWALTLLDNALQRLREEYRARDRVEVLDALQPFLGGNAGEERYATVAARLGWSENALKVAVHRLRSRYGTLLRQVIADTVDSPDAVEEEIQHLYRVLANPGTS